MSIKFKVKVVKIGNSLRITIPQQIAESLNIAAGDTVSMEVTDGEILVKKNRG